MINRVSIFNAFIFSCVLSCCLILLIPIAIAIRNFTFCLGAITWFITSIINIGVKINIADIEINTDNTAQITSLMKKIIIDTANLKINYAYIGRRSAFIVETNLGTYILNFTKANYYQLITLMEMTSYKSTNDLRKMVKSTSVGLR